MTWPGLLCETRQRELRGGAPSAGDHDSVRAAFDRDYDRTLFCTPVRRLQDKAQVFPLEPNDSVRTRLTHSLEVSAVAGNIARRVIALGIPGLPGGGAIPAIATTAGLLHDLGNPPFGHSGEDAMRAWFAQRSRDLCCQEETLDDLPEPCRQDFLRFEGNAQTLRLVTQLQILADWDGLNLTAGTLAAACKYTASSDQASRSAPDHAHHKPGYFQSEQNLIQLIRTATGVGIARHPITFMVEAADDIVYSIIDLEDGVKKGVLSWSTLAEQLREANDPTIDAALDSAEGRVSKSPLRLHGASRDEALIRALRTATIGRAVDAAARAFAVHHDAILAGAYPGELTGDSDAATLIRTCKQIGREHVYSAPDVIQREIMGRRVIHDLMDLFWSAAKSFDPSWIDAAGRLKTATHEAKVYSMLSRNYRAVFEASLRRGSLPSLYIRLQLVTDNIAGMTDTYAVTMHRELTGG